MIDERAVEAAARALLSVVAEEVGVPSLRWEGGNKAAREQYRQYARAALTAALPLLIGEGWRPIESAPQDGTPIWAWQRGRGQFVAWFAEHLDDGWYWTDEADDEPEPTHWMPLPAAPDFRSAPEEAAPLSPGQQEA